MTDIHVLYESDSLLVINKPSGVVVNRAESVKEATIQDWAESRLQITDHRLQNQDKEAAVFYQRSGIAHRLDKETSGCLLIAKSPESLTELLHQFKNREVKKTYQALVHGRIEPSSGTWRLPIGRSQKRRTEFIVDPFGKISETSYRVLEYYQRLVKNTLLEWLTYLEVMPKTGRTHQIRVHAKHMHHPLVGDKVYLNPKQLEIDSEWCPRLWLHAAKIILLEPGTNKKIEVEAPVPQDLLTTVASLNTV